MTDHYQSFVSSPVGQLFVKNLGLPNPTKLERWTEGAPVVDGTVVTGGSGRLGKALTVALDNLGVSNVGVAPEGEKFKALVFDATGITHSTDLIALQQFFTPLMRSLTDNARVLVLGTVPELVEDKDERVAQRALEGFTRSLGKEIGKGSTVNLVYVAPGAEETIESTLSFFLSPKSAYVSGQVARLGATGHDGGRPGRRPGQAADRQGRHRHRRLARHRRADRPGAAPRRRDGARHRRTPGGQRAPVADEGARR